jgi:hypothetical protein
VQVGDIVKLIDRYALDSHKGHCGVVVEKGPWNHTVVVAFPLGPDKYRTSVLEIVSASR